MTHNVKWKVSLTNGETHYEGKGLFTHLQGQKSPWQRLIDYTIEKKALITSLSLYTDQGTTFNLPSAGKNPKFHAFDIAEKPIDYGCSRVIARDIDIKDDKVDNIEIADWFTIAEAIYPSYKLQIWVDERNTRNSWCIVIPLLI